MLLDAFPVGPIQANCVLLGDPSTGVLAVIDPGEEAPRILERIEASGLSPSLILHTHGHLDHAGGTAELARRLGPEVPIGLHRDELDLYRSLAMQGRMFGLEAVTPPEPTLWLAHGDRLAVGRLELEVRHTPGHSPGGVCFVVHGAPEPTVVVGDVLFAGSIGRTDLFGGSFEVLERSIRDQLYSLPDATRVVCGHGPDTTIGREKRSNPFVRG
ncbi:MAG TPA: MBL fold metallo-hydrolase [Thermoanaerobaculales bacterium]|nr:MBL fold metallo-hydrolase [Thermoanaerobaculales bacterium]HPA81841.1 MBL fold metallo-hydrolase [Thermoanaerobaculales bacterium]HQL30426.1 MBL fold metallo-hydrolase [Thermoanaerobaculales bacterium]HQN97679.1 MBL fold metallo-hydrolase [Thermoanaerobaculales bacterium]